MITTVGLQQQGVNNIKAETKVASSQQPGCSGIKKKVGKAKRIKSTFCGDCGDDYLNPKGKNVDWYQCLICQLWFHEDCDKGSIKRCGLCTMCDNGDSLASDSESD